MNEFVILSVQLIPSFRRRQLFSKPWILFSSCFASAQVSESDINTDMTLLLKSFSFYFKEEVALLQPFFSTGKALGEHKIEWGGKTFLQLDYADDLSIVDESLSKMNELLEILRVLGARIGLRINAKKIKLIRLGISED
jgi:hypothetical protein